MWVLLNIRLNFRKVVETNEFEKGTLEVHEYQFVYRDKRVHLIDTPGFDDTHRSDREVLDDIARWMGTAYSQDIKLSGIIYLQRITDTRFSGSASRNLVMFKKLCGEECFKRVVLATTMWDLVDEAVGEAREKELTRTEHFWGQMIAGGSRVERHYGDRDSAMDILKYIVKYGKKDVLRVQKEMVDGKLTLDETSAGREVSREIIEQRKKYEDEIKKLQADREELIKMNELKAAEQLAKQQKEFEHKIRKGYEDQEKLRASLEQLQEQKAAELREMQEQLEETRQAFRAQMEDLERIKSQLEQAEPSSGCAVALRHQISTQEEGIEEVRRNLAEQEAIVEEKKRSSSINDLSGLVDFQLTKTYRFLPSTLRLGEGASSGYGAGNHGWIKGIINDCKGSVNQRTPLAYGDLSVLCYSILSIQGH